jgi:farnesyl-diphosphate farnesyltransferase
VSTALSTVDFEALHPSVEAQLRLGDLLTKASRTFAITIPFLPQPLRDAMSVAYLLMRNADTLEDTAAWSRSRRIAELTRFSFLMRHPSVNGGRDFAARFDSVECIEDPGHHDVLLETGFLMQQLMELPSGMDRIVAHHVDRVAGQMMYWVGRHDDDNQLELRRIRELDDYCYAVAGIVGEMITELIEASMPDLSEASRRAMIATATDFGVGLQLTNIVKDSWRDRQAGRVYVPEIFLPAPGDSAESLEPILRLAFDRLTRGIEYTCALPVQAEGVRRFCLIPLVLAAATLRELRASGTALFDGHDVKISRAEVAGLVGTACAVAKDNNAIRETWAALGEQLLA